MHKRQAERTALEAERLVRENQRRAGRGLPALKSMEGIDGREDPDADAVLAEATQIAADVDLAGRGTGGARVTQAGQEREKSSCRALRAADRIGTLL